MAERDYLETCLVSLTDREIAEAVGLEMGRRGVFGCIYMFPQVGGEGVFASSSPPGLLNDLSASEQLTVFAEAASYATRERKVNLSTETRNPEGGKWGPN